MTWWQTLLIILPVVMLVIWLGLPLLLHAIGLHPSHDMPVFNLAGKRALVITTSHDTAHSLVWSIQFKGDPKRISDSDKPALYGDFSEGG